MNHNSTTIHTEGGPVSSGTFTVQDGDFVAGNKITNYTRLDPTDSRNQRNHAVLRQTVRRFWVDGVLKCSLYNEMLIRLGLDARPEAVDNRPWDLILQQPGLPDEVVDNDKEIATIFDEMNQRLLILGKPGAGKTTTLLTLADALLQRADADPTLPTAVVFNLSSWAEEELPLDEWLVNELENRYYIRKDVSQNWFENGELLLLLDGLDEVVENKQAACVKAINDFRQEHNIVELVVCSRTEEYSSLSEQLKLEGAVAVRPLTMDQVDAYVAQAGPHLTGLRQALAQSETLHELAQTPLMLSVMALAYYDHHGQDKAVDVERTEHEHLFDRYIQRMFEHRDFVQLYPADHVLLWLRWLAVQMTERSQTIFFIERLQPDWLGAGLQIHLYRLTILLICVLIGVLMFGLNIGLIGGLVVGLPHGLANNTKPRENLSFSMKNALVYGLIGTLIGLLMFGPIGLLSVGMACTLIGGLYEIKRWQELRRLWIPMIGGMVLGLIFGLIFGLSVGLSIGLMLVLSGGAMRSSEAEFKEQPNQGIWQSLKNGLIVGTGSSLVSGLIFGLVGVMSGLCIGMIFGLTSCVKHLILRCLLYHKSRIPWNYARFLDYAAARLFLRKVGGGYVFVHRMIMEHFASLTDEDIARIVRGV